jgi:SAM-dependent methyltransferase
MKYSFNEIRRLDRILACFGLWFIITLKNKLKTFVNDKRNSSKLIRYLEIGPGSERIPMFEALNLFDGRNVDYVCDLKKALPFADNSFNLIYASHVIEHIPWYLQKQLLKELYRILKPSGTIEIWVPDGSKIIKAIYDFENESINNTNLDGWYVFNDDKDVLLWANGRIFSYGDGLGTASHQNWHKTLFTQYLLTKLLKNVGFNEIKAMSNNEVRGVSHGWINLGIKATKQ